MTRVRSEEQDAGHNAMWDLIDTAIETVGAQPHIDTDAMRLVFTLRTASGTVFHDLHRRLREADASSPRVMNTLMLLSMWGEIEQGTLARYNGYSKAAISTLVEQMVQDGLITRRTSPEDRRVTLLSITEEGREAFEFDFATFNAGEAAWAAGLTPSERQTLTRLLEKLVNHRAVAVADPAESRLPRTG